MNPTSLPLSRLSRVATLLAAPLVAAAAAFDPDGGLIHPRLALLPPVDGYITGLGRAIAPLVLVALAAVLVRLLEGAARRRPRGPSLIDHLDVLTPTGSAVLWTSAAALWVARLSGWASPAVIGGLGFGVVYATATWLALVAAGDEPWRRARVERTVLPERALAGEPVREEILLAGVRIPTGFRLFVSGDTGRLGARSRYVVDSEASSAEVRLEGELGPAVRGEHRLPALDFRLQDLLGLCQTPIARFGAARFTGLPRPAQVDGVAELLGRGGDDPRAVEARQLPTDGQFKLREYAAGDDTRRIHWVRSLTSRQLIVRLPDELPPEQPAVRLILDSHLVGAATLACRAPAELLDALVQVWLGVGAAIARDGTRVDLIAPVRREDGGVEVVERAIAGRELGQALRLGARVEWQHEVTLADLLAGGPARQIVVSSRPRPGEATPGIVWVVLPVEAWTRAEPAPPPPSLAELPYASGAEENRLGNRLAAQATAMRAARDAAIFRRLLLRDGEKPPIAWFARPAGERVALEVR